MPLRLFDVRRKKMVHIIRLKDALKKRKKNKPSNDINTLLKKAAILKKNLSEPQNGIHVTSFQKLKTLFEVKISEILIKRQFIDSDFFLCGSYISGLLTDLSNKIPKSWFAIDYILENNETNSPQALKQGANICFLICSVFKERSEIRAMTYHDYEKMGIGLFHQFYNQTGAEIGYYMSRQYKIMVRVTDECLRTI